MDLTWAGIGGRDAERDGDAWHVVRSVYRGSQAYAMHGHTDFAEVCWIESGAIWHMTPGTKRRMLPGDCVFVGPGQSHALRATGEPAVLVNIALPEADLAALSARYATEPAWPWTSGEEPTLRHLAPEVFDSIHEKVRAYFEGDIKL